MTDRLRKSSVAIVVPTGLRLGFTPDEEISLRHLEYFLGDYDRYFVSPVGVSPVRPGFAVESFPTHYFGSAPAHARLSLSEEFYARFRHYKYMLMHHLDALVLSSGLERWCDANLDLIGAPWLPCDDSPWVERARVGNGGFALMKVESHLNVLRSTRRGIDPDEYWELLRAATPLSRRWLQWPRKYLKRLAMFNNVRWEIRRWPSRANADYFWADRAVQYWPDFTIASVEQALEFSFEVAPRLCFELNKRRLPFGCHAWGRYDRSFWEPYLLPASQTCLEQLEAAGG